LAQRKLTADEIGICRSFYAIGGHMRFLSDTYHLNMLLPQVADVIQHGTSDGKPPIQVDRVPTAADIGKRVKVRDNESNQWSHNHRFVGFAASSRFVAQHDLSGTLAGWQYCIIDQEATNGHV
jgi:hypothetical protein